MLGSAARGLFQSARQVRRATVRQVKKQQQARTAGRQSGETRRTVCGLARDESVIINQQRQTIGRARFFETMPRVVMMGTVSVLTVGAIDALVISLKDLADDDDDGR